MAPALEPENGHLANNLPQSPLRPGRPESRAPAGVHTQGLQPAWSWKGPQGCSSLLFPAETPAGHRAPQASVLSASGWGR